MNAYTRGYSLTRIGLITVVACSAFTAAFLYMTNRSLTQHRSTLYVQIPTAEGLKKGDQVLHRGVQVGEVRGIEFGGHDVVINVKLTQRVLLARDASAAMVAADIFGRQVVVLHDGDQPERLADRDTIDGTPPSSMTARMEDLGRSAQRLVGDTTAQLLHETMRGLSELSGELTQLARQSRALLERETSQVHAISTTATTLLNNLAVTTAPERWTPITTHVTQAAERLDTTTLALQQVAQALSTSQGTAGLLLSDPALYERMTGSLAALESLLTDVRANPKRYINVSIF